jgi:DivIVA domain-containing protein
MGQLFLFVVVALVVAAIVFGVTVMVSGGDSGLTPVEPDGKSVPLPSDRPLGEEDIFRTKFDTAFRGYRMAQVDQALQRAAYDIGYKGELIGVLEAEVAALREGRTADADVLRRAREAAVAPPADPVVVVPDVTPADDKTAAAQSASALSASDQSASAQSAFAKPGSAQSTPAESASAQPASGQPAEGRPGTEAAPARAAGDEEPAESR